jgi:hypothetical protein
MLSYKIKKHASIGAADAESDKKFLKDCFIDNGDLEQLLDIRNPKCIIIGRTGAGKSALIEKLSESSNHLIGLDLEGLSLAYVSNSDVLAFFEKLGVHLDVFYSLLWRHIFTVELLKFKYKINKQNENGFWSKIYNAVNNNKKEKEIALKYLQQWGDKFWEETEYRVKEFVTKLEDSLKTGTGIALNGLSMSSESITKLSDEVRGEVIYKAQKIVNEVQIKELSKVVDLLAEDIFADEQNPYFITVDKLDENWVSEPIKYNLIRNLLETIKTFKRIPGVKIVVSLRLDLLDRVFSKTRRSGHQEEKYEQYYLYLRWSENELKALVDSRIRTMFQEQYTTKSIGIDDIFTNKAHGDPVFKYMCDRTFMRPRDIILFINNCLSLVENKTAVPVATIKEAESEYSKKRLNSLADEWIADFTYLIPATNILRGRKSVFKLSEISNNEFESFIIETCSEQPENSYLFKLASDFTDNKKSKNQILISLIMTFYKVGLIGVKPDAFNEVQWSLNEKASISEGQIKNAALINIHPMFWRALGIQANRPSQ